MSRPIHSLPETMRESHVVSWDQNGNIWYKCHLPCLEGQGCWAASQDGDGNITFWAVHCVEEKNITLSSSMALIPNTPPAQWRDGNIKSISRFWSCRSRFKTSIQERIYRGTIQFMFASGSTKTSALGKSCMEERLKTPATVKTHRKGTMAVIGNQHY